MEAGIRSRGLGMPPVTAMLLWAASPSDTGNCNGNWAL